MSRFWSRLTNDLHPYVPGEQPRIADLVKLNTNESPFGPSPGAMEAIRREAAETLRLYPDPQALALRTAVVTKEPELPPEVAGDNPGAIALYAGAGFERVGRRVGYYARTGAPSVAAIVMRRALNS